MRWQDVIVQIQGGAERAGYACMEFVLFLLRAIIKLITRLRAKDSDGGGSYLDGFPEQ